MNERELIISELERVRAMLYKNEQLYDLASDETETEALIYECKALRLRYSALIVKARELGIRSEGWDLK
ncbi:MAG: hypothetical protein IJT87_10220 [Ruminiclostridium sp.]|nr:hypothetical protein [Ruminiclostridium sp.]